MTRLTLAASVLSFVGAVALCAAETQTRRVYFSALDKKGAPVADLKATEVVVTEEGQRQTPLTVEHATTPMRIALVVDDRGLGVPEVRDGLSTFVVAMRGLADVGVFSAARAEGAVVAFTHETPTLLDGIRGLVPMHLAGAGLEPLIEEVTSQFERQRPERPVMIVLTIDPDALNAPASLASPAANNQWSVPPAGNGRSINGVPNGISYPPRWPLVVRKVQRSGTTFFAVVARHTGSNDHDPVIDASAEATGGRVAPVLTDSGIPNALKRITDDLLGQYAVTYHTSATWKDGVRFKVSVNRAGVVVRAPELVGVR